MQTTFSGADFLGALRVKCDYLYILANNAGIDQTPRSAASDLGLHCLPMSQH